MKSKKLIEGKWVLIVDDEKDVIESLVELLEMCRIDTAISFEEGKQLLQQNKYDAAILDIMGVSGFELLEVAKQQGIPALMLTAHALSEDNLKRSAEEGASYYAPKEEMNRIVDFVADVVEAKEKNKNPWVRLVERLGDYFDKQFKGPNWRETQKKFWDEKVKYYGGRI